LREKEKLEKGKKERKVEGPTGGHALGPLGHRGLRERKIDRKMK